MFVALSTEGANAGPGSAHQERADAATACPSDMIEVRGSYCPDLPQQCLQWLSNEQGGFDRCAVFAPSGPCQTTSSKKHFCIDHFEYPNKHGERPVVMK